MGHDREEAAHTIRWQQGAADGLPTGGCQASLMHRRARPWSGVVAGCSCACLDAEEAEILTGPIGKIG
ncbi:hypothetical protein NDU88_005655 [Pleurodeles waltl]|uniref:Uncharacterized protein n=1 Tax=Pleurodeles waltl TaxID=8319 RepID=A0AAV7N6H6_PLEWA|nr:hypothetical protein NDU88_005655 [Pleurodeles waltl]